MKKNLLQPETLNEVLVRLGKLSADTKSQWGKMNVNQMLWHTNQGLKNAFDEVTFTPNRSGKLGKAIMKFIIMKTNMPTPKEKAETFKEINTVTNGINPPDFQAEREALRETLNRFPNSSKWADESALLGKMTKEEWGRLQYTHLDHHFKQFGA